MTTHESLLAAALQELRHRFFATHVTGDQGLNDNYDPEYHAAAILATPEGARLLAAAEVGLAVERWFAETGEELTIAPSDYGYIVFGEACGSNGFCPGHSTLIAAINAALEDTP